MLKSNNKSCISKTNAVSQQVDLRNRTYFEHLSTVKLKNVSFRMVYFLVDGSTYICNFKSTHVTLSVKLTSNARGSSRPAQVRFHSQIKPNYNP